MKHFNRESCFKFWEKSECHRAHRCLGMRNVFYMLYITVAHHERGYETKFGTSSPLGSIFNHFLKITEIGRKNDRVALFTAVHLVIENVHLVNQNCGSQCAYWCYRYTCPIMAHPTTDLWQGARPELFMEGMIFFPPLFLSQSGPSLSALWTG